MNGFNLAKNRSRGILKLGCKNNPYLTRSWLRLTRKSMAAKSWLMPLVGKRRLQTKRFRNVNEQIF